jgi:DNA mismatch repair protein MutL
MMAISAVAAPSLPFDGPATPLAHRYARELRAQRHLGSQASLGFGGPSPHTPQQSPPSRASSPRAWVDAIRERSSSARHTERSAELALARAEAYQGERGGDRAAVDHAAPAHGAGRILPFDTALAASLERGDFDAPVSPPTDEPASREGSATDQPLAVPRGTVLADGRVVPLDGEPVGSARIAEGSGPTPRAAYFTGLRYLGQLDLTYLVCEAAGEMVLVDQHAAHERVELARLIRRSANEHAAVQKLLFPVTIEASPAQLGLVERAHDILAAVGYEAEAFGKATLAIKAVPAGIRHGDPAQLLGELLEAWDDGLTPEQHVARALAAIACRSVVRAGDRLAPNEAESLLRSLDDVDVEAGQAVHGRALLLRFPIAEIGRRFGR